MQHVGVHSNMCKDFVVHCTYVIGYILHLHQVKPYKLVTQAAVMCVYVPLEFFTLFSSFFLFFP